jgi:hypothetical protein
VTEAAELEAWMERRDRRATVLAVVALVLAVLLPVALTSISEDWSSVSFFNSALLAHELGHRTAMGWRGRPALFLATLFGARHPAPGPERSRQALFWLHVMGALPGLVVGGVVRWLEPLLYWLPELQWFALGLVVLGFLSLLPVPLADGGHILDQVLLPRAPLVAFRIQLVAVVVVTLAGILAMFIALLMAVPLAVALVRARQLARVRARRGPAVPERLDGAGALAAVSEAGYGQFSFARRRRLAAQLLADSTAPPLPATTAILLAAVYLAALAAGPAILA